MKSLTTRQLQIAVEQAAGLSRKQIAHKHSCAQKTVDAHLLAARRKLGIRRSSELPEALELHGEMAWMRMVRGVANV